MATVLLSAAGAAIGGSVGGTLAGLSAVAVGRAVGATLGRVIDQRLLGQGSEVVEQGKVDRFRLTNAGEGAAIPQIYGRMRVSGQLIWASDFVETTTTTGGGKGGPPQPKTKTYSYSVNLAIALCEGEILRVGRVWADGEEVARDTLNMRVYTGSEDQLPDPTMEAIEGTGEVPAYRGTAYVVFDNLSLEPFGNRVPQFSFEVLRAEQGSEAEEELARSIRGVALMPGTGEYALASTSVNIADGDLGAASANVNSPSGKADLLTSLENLGEELPGCEAVSLVVSWFGDDLRCGNCTVRPKVERLETEGQNMPWSVSGLTRANADEIAQDGDRPIYGGTPADASVVEAIQAMNTAGKAVMFYPFILMDQLEGNDLPNPYSGEIGQPVLPWRGRITTSLAAGLVGTPDRTGAADDEVAAFFGTATEADFAVSNGFVHYTGPQEWSFSRFILHYAALCAAAGGVEAFCIGSEMRGLTWIRGAGDTFVAVTRLRELAAEVRSILGAGTKISYAADWSEYFGYQPQDGSGDRYFHLDPLWADANIDFIGIDNYMRLSDWREGTDHTDAAFGAVYNLDYLSANVAGGEGYDWFYHSSEAEAAQIRTPIKDEAHDEAWIFRYKDIRNWWQNAHHERIAGVRQATATDWLPQSKPIWFTEYGCAAIDKGTNQPNKFLDPKSSESRLPKFSTGARDDLIQKQYYRALTGFWTDIANNPISEEYDAPMINMDRAFAWAWDARPFPFFPNNVDLWSDGENYPRGHWLNGRAAGRTLASVVEEICTRAGLTEIDTSRLYGYVRGYVVDDVGDARAALQPLMLRFGFDAIEQDGVLRFRMRDGLHSIELDPEKLAVHSDLDGVLEQSREAEAELMGRVRLRFSEADGDFETRAEEAILPDAATHAISSSELPMSLTGAEARQVTERWLIESRLARETVRFALPLSQLSVAAGDVISLPGEQTEGERFYRIDRAELGPSQLLEAVNIDPEAYRPSRVDDSLPSLRSFVPPVPLTSLFLDLPLLSGDEVPHAPHVAATAAAWPGSAAVYQADQPDDFALNIILEDRAIIGKTRSVLTPARSGVFDRGPDLEVELVFGSLASIGETSLLNGRNVAAIGDGSPDRWELIQFEKAELIAQGRYLLSKRLRGQLGTEAFAAEAWPEGSYFVLLNGAPEQIDYPSALRRVAQTFRIGPAQRSLDDPSYSEVSLAFDGNGLRPYSPVHIKAIDVSGDLHVNWIRRTRVDGDSWDLDEVPLAEESERYLVRVSKGSSVLRETHTSSPSWIYNASEQLSDGAIAPFSVSVAQVSSRYGLGLFGHVSVDV